MEFLHRIFNAFNVIYMICIIIGLFELDTSILFKGVSRFIKHLLGSLIV